MGFERVSDPVVWAVAPPSKEFPLQRYRRARRGWLVVPGVIVGCRDRHGVVVVVVGLSVGQRRGCEEQMCIKKGRGFQTATFSKLTLANLVRRWNTLGSSVMELSEGQSSELWIIFW